MLTLEELQAQKNDINERRQELQIYMMESRQIQGDIIEITYRVNSGIGDIYGQIESKSSLKSQLREMNAELKRRHQLTPRLVPYRIREYDDAISKINRQLNELENQAMTQTHQTRQQEHSRDGDRDR